MQRKFSLFLLVTVLLSVFFVSQQISSAKGAKEVTFSKDIAPIFNAKCAECHRPADAAPFSTLTYKDVRPWAKSIKEKVVNRTMPPWHADPHFGQFKNDRSLSQKEIDTIVAWVDGGAKEGNGDQEADEHRGGGRGRQPAGLRSHGRLDPREHRHLY